MMSDVERAGVEALIARVEDLEEWRGRLVESAAAAIEKLEQRLGVLEQKAATASQQALRSAVALDLALDEAVGSFGRIVADMSVRLVALENLRFRVEQLEARRVDPGALERRLDHWQAGLDQRLDKLEGRNAPSGAEELRA